MRIDSAIGHGQANHETLAVGHDEVIGICLPGKVRKPKAGGGGDRRLAIYDRLQPQVGVVEQLSVGQAI